VDHRSLAEILPAGHTANHPACDATGSPDAANHPTRDATDHPVDHATHDAVDPARHAADHSIDYATEAAGNPPGYTAVDSAGETMIDTLGRL
jgi:hypothetical protein